MDDIPTLKVENLTSKSESTYFGLVLVFALLAWLFLLVSFLAIWAIVIGVMMWFGAGILAAHLRSEAVEVNEGQLPELYTIFGEVCQSLGLREIPRLYVMESGGLLNAFTMRFSGRNFVVLYADIVETFGADSKEVRFIMGHEVGHIHRAHIIKGIFLGPGLIMPLLGSAYSRACESTCDRYGAYAAQSVQASANAMLALAGGKEAPQLFNATQFAEQYYTERGFFVSVHELASGYPTLSRRVGQLLALNNTRFEAKAGRNVLAYPFALFSPGAGAGSAGSLMVFVVIIGLLAAMAIPAFQKVREQSQEKACINNMRILESAYDMYALENGEYATLMEELTVPDYGFTVPPVCLIGGEYGLELDANDQPITYCSEHGTQAEALQVNAGYSPAGY
jgi:Zn-dependent protease with chaperone function